jgi:hypothetical protein
MTLMHYHSVIDGNWSNVNGDYYCGIQHPSITESKRSICAAEKVAIRQRKDNTLRCTYEANPLIVVIDSLKRREIEWQ